MLSEALDVTVILVGLVSFAMRAWRYHIHQWSIIIENLLYITIVCLFVIPWLRDTFEFEDETTYIWTYFLSQSAKPTVDLCIDVIRTRLPKT